MVMKTVISQPATAPSTAGLADAATATTAVTNTAPYRHPVFAEAHSHLGSVVSLPASGSFAYLRTVPQGGIDAAALYPLWQLESATDLQADFDQLRAQSVISFVGVCLPLQAIQQQQLEVHADHWRQFKRHYFYDPDLPFQYSKHHRYEIRRASRCLQTRWSTLSQELDGWCLLYDNLRQRHGLTGLHAFPRRYFETLCALPGLRVLVAEQSGTPVAMHLWMDDGCILWSHLAASADAGYQCGAAYLMNDAVIREHGDADKRLIGFGGVAGNGDDDHDGLARFKRGFSNRTESSFLFGKILDAPRYQALSAMAAASDFFPAYRYAGKAT